MLSTVPWLAALVLLATPVADCPPVEEAPYVILRSADLATLERLVNEAATGGRRLLASSTSGEHAGNWVAGERDKLSVLMGPDPTSPGPHEYVLLDGEVTGRKLRRRLAEHAAQGFRLRPPGLITQDRMGSIFFGANWHRHVLLLERGRDRGPWEYAVELLGPSKRALRPVTGRLQEGFRLVGLTRYGSGAVAVLERAGSSAPEVPAASAPPRELRVVWAWTAKRLQRRLSQAAAEGYTYLAGVRHHYDELLLERTRAPRDACELRLPTGPSGEPEETLNALGREGFRVEPRSEFGGRLVLTRPPTSRSSCQYRLVTERHEEPGCPATAEAVGEGYHVLGLSWPIVKLERCEEPAD